MPRYIDADKLNLYDELFMKGVNNSGVWVRYRDVENLIKNAPIVDVEEASFYMPYRAVKDLHKYLFDRYDELPDAIKCTTDAMQEFLIDNL